MNPRSSLRGANAKCGLYIRQGGLHSVPDTPPLYDPTMTSAHAQREPIAIVSHFENWPPHTSARSNIVTYAGRRCSPAAKRHLCEDKLGLRRLHRLPPRQGRSVRTYTFYEIQCQIVSTAWNVRISLADSTPCASVSIKGNATGQVLADTGAFLKDVDMFDHMEFGITARDARAMPLSTRKLVETSFLSLMDAGIHYRGQNVGCYMAGVVSDIHSTSGHVRLALMS